VDEAAPGLCCLAGPDRVRVGRGGVLKITEQVRTAELVADPAEGVVVDVPVVHDDRAVQVAVDEALERRQVPVAQAVAGEQARARDVQVFLAGLRSRPDPDGVSSPQIDGGEQDQRPDRLIRRGHGAGGALQQAAHPPVAGPGPGHRLEDVRAPLHGEVMHHHQEHAQAWKFSP
jgi:hypothetical protein